MTNMPEVKLSQHLIFISTATAIIISDQITKSMVRTNMSLGQSIPADGKFRLSFSTNDGAVFGLPLNSTFLVITACIIVAATVWLYLLYLSGKSRLLQVGTGLVLGGAVGNLTDRFRFGAVTDFIDIRLWGNYHWPSFNIADAALTIGISILAFSLLSMSKPKA